MADDDTRDETAADGAAARLRGALGRARQVPRQLHEVSDDLGDAQAARDEVRDALSRLEELAWAGRLDTQGGVDAIGDELHRLHRHLDAAQAGVADLDRALAAQVAALHRAVAAPARTAAADALRASLGPSSTPVDGLSVFVTCWNHGVLLPDAVTSALAALDRLPSAEQGQVIVLDDASTDRTAEVAARLAADDPRVRVLHSDVNLGLTHGRNVLLHAVGTTHAFNLDADNVALPAGVAELYQVARQTGAASTYGTVVQVGEDGAIGPISNEPLTPALFTSNYIDTMAVVDIEAIRRLGGWSTDPLTEHVDDWTMLRRLAEAGALLAFVPTLVGRYRVLPGAFHRTTPDKRLGAGRVARVTDPTGRREGPDAMAGIAAIAAHPTTGVLWATPEARALRPDLDPAVARPRPVAPPAAVGPRVLVMAPGGVANLGDDAITEGGLARLREVLPTARIDLLTDGGQPPPLPVDVRWLGPLIDALPGLTHDEVAGADDVALTTAAAAARVGEGRWRPLEPAVYDVAIVLGGGSLASTWSGGLIGPRAVLASALRTAGVPYACSGQGVGPLTDATDRTLVGSLLAGALAVACRDEASAALVASLEGIDTGRLAVTGDDALGLGAAAVRPDGPGVLAVTVRRAGYVGDETDHALARWARAVDEVAVERGWEVRGVALNQQQPEPELATLARLRATVPLKARWRIVECAGDPARLVAAVADASAVAAQSFHAALLALDAGVPAVLATASPYYEAKAAGLAERSGLPPEIGVADPDRLGDALDAVHAALVEHPRPLAAATEAVDGWWRALPATLGVDATG